MACNKLGALVMALKINRVVVSFRLACHYFSRTFNLL